MRKEQLRQLAEDGDENAASDLYREQGVMVYSRGPGVAPQPVAIDFETYYTSEYSLKKMGVDQYVNDPRFEATLVALAAPDEQWVGNPKDAPWEKFHNRVFLAHNVGFDKTVFERLQADGIIPESVSPVMWSCTAAMSAFLQAPRDLSGAGKALLKREIDKSVREAMQQ